MAYRALYRTYRPRNFSGVIGQEHITTVLRHQIEQNKAAHAYLFCGSRGTGKTTTARIMARAVNCLRPQGGEPCGSCSACRASLEENNPDIFEIDAASNNGVDDVRALIEQVQYAPMTMKTRVFIVDEVHMLTGSAFNALLKTLEEPPADVLFILATTEPQKLPATIVSRCQRFDFHRLSVQNIVSTLKGVLAQVGAVVEEEGLLLIARSADGGMRDALSLTDQCLAFCGDHVAARDVYDVLGSMEEGFLFEISEALISSDGDKALRMLDDIVRGGRDLTVFTGDLAGHFRSLLLAKTCGACTELLDCTDDAMGRYLKQSAGASSGRLLRALELLLGAQGDMRYLSMPRAMIESVLIRICRPEEEKSIAALTERVERLESGGVPFVENAAVEAIALRAAARAGAAIAPAAAIGAAERQAGGAARDQAGASPRPEDEGDCREDDGIVDEPPPEAEGYFTADFEQDAPQAFRTDRHGEREARDGGRRSAALSQSGAGDKASRPSSAAAASSGGAEGTQARNGAFSSPKEGKGGAPVYDAGGEALWNAVLRGMAAQNPLVHAIAKNGVAQSLTKDTLTVSFSPAHGVYYDGCSAPINLNKLQGILDGVSPGVHLTLVRMQPVPADPENVERAKALFGDKLKIR